METWSDIKSRKPICVFGIPARMDEYAIQSAETSFGVRTQLEAEADMGWTSLVQRISELHKAEVDIQSTLGKGSSFTLTFSLDTNTLSEYEIS